MTSQSPSETPFSRPIRVEAIPKEGLDAKISANAAELVALARIYELPKLKKLEATLLVRRVGREGAHVTGEVITEATRNCIVTLEAFEVALAEPVDVHFAPNKPVAEGKNRKSAEREIEINSEADVDEPDLVVEGHIDLGALAAEFMALGLDPYPRKPGIEFESEPEPVRPSPFAGLGDALAKRKT